MQMTGSLTNDSQGVFSVHGNSQVSFAGGVVNHGDFTLTSTAAQSSGGQFTNNGSLSGSGRLNHQFTNNGTTSINAVDDLTINNGVNNGINNGMIQIGGGKLEVTAN